MAEKPQAVTCLLPAFAISCHTVLGGVTFCCVTSCAQVIRFIQLGAFTNREQRYSSQFFFFRGLFSFVPQFTVWHLTSYQLSQTIFGSLNWKIVSSSKIHQHSSAWGNIFSLILNSYASLSNIKTWIVLQNQHEIFGQVLCCFSVER